jgi:ubiquinone/menaquinone biosynthesis C-methylase UbiE
MILGGTPGPGTYLPLPFPAMSTESELNPSWDYDTEQAKLLALGVHGQDTSDFDAIVASRHSRKAEIMTRLNLGPNDTVMDLGSGMGFIAEVIGPEVKSIHCCDISSVFLEDCAKRTSHLPNVVTHQIGYADLTAAQGQGINKVYSTLLFIHFNFYDIMFYLQEINKVLDMGGLVYFDYNDGERYKVDNMADSFQEHVAIYKEHRESWVFGCMHMTSRHLLENLIPQLGFEIVENWPTTISFSQMLLRKVAPLT